jgi:hypothetical protein
MTDTTTIPMDDLGFDAKVLAGAWFGMGMRTSVTLHLRESRPTARTQAAMDELVSRGVMSAEPFNEFGGLVLKPLVDCRDASRWFHGIMGTTGEGGDPEAVARAKWTLYEAIDEDQAYELMTPFGKGVWDKEKRGRKPRDNPYDAETAPLDYAQWRKGHRLGAKA